MKTDQIQKLISKLEKPENSLCGLISTWRIADGLLVERINTKNPRYQLVRESIAGSLEDVFMDERRLS